MTSALGWHKMAGVGGMLENTSSQESEETSDRRFSPRSQACRKFTTCSDGFIHEKITPCVDKSPKSLKVVRMNGAAAGSSPKPVQPSKPVLRSRGFEKSSPESLVKKKRSNSQTLLEESPRSVHSYCSIVLIAYVIMQDNRDNKSVDWDCLLRIGFLGCVFT